MVPAPTSSNKSTSVFDNTLVMLRAARGGLSQKHAEAGAHRALVHGVRALVGVHVARDHDVHAVLVEQVLQVLLEVGRQLARALGGVVRLVKGDDEPPAKVV